MMRQFVREYGLLILCSLGILLGMLLYRAYSQDVLAYSLDLVGDRLIGMASGDEDKTTIAALYDAFKKRVLAREVSPDRVEHVAENILNLNRSGATLTTEQAEMILDESMLVLADYDSAASRQPASVDPAQLEDVGKKLKTLCEFDTRLQTLAEASLAGRELRKQVHYECRDGLRVTVDPRLRQALPPPEFMRLSEELKTLERGAMVVWRQHVADTLRVVRLRVQEELRSLEGLGPDVEQRIQKRLKRLQALEKLSAFDYHMDEKALDRLIEQRMKRMEERLKEAQERLKRAEPAPPPKAGRL